MNRKRKPRPLPKWVVDYLEALKAAWRKGEPLPPIPKRAREKGKP